MSPSGSHSLRSPELSAIIRYERIARLEAALTLRQKQRRRLLVYWALVVTGMAAGVAVCLMP